MDFSLSFGYLRFEKRHEFLIGKLYLFDCLFSRVLKWLYLIIENNEKKNCYLFEFEFSCAPFFKDLLVDFQIFPGHSIVKVGAHRVKNFSHSGLVYMLKNL